MALRISNAELNSLMDSVLEGNGGFDAGFTDDPAMDEYLYEQESLDFLDFDLQDRYKEYEQQERMDDGCIDYQGHYSDPYDYDWCDVDPLDEYYIPQQEPVREKAVEERSRPMTIAEIVAKHKAVLYHEH